MRQHVRDLERKLEVIGGIAILELGVPFGRSITVHIGLKVGESLVDEERGVESLPQEEDVGRLAGPGVSWELDRFEVVVEWDWSSTDLFLLRLPAEPHVSGDRDSGLDQRQRLVTVIFGFFDLLLGAVAACLCLCVALFQRHASIMLCDIYSRSGISISCN